MRCTRVEFKGYKRLADTAVNIDGDLTAFVGFNEAGKTTLLEALQWFTNGGALSVTDRNRSRPPASDKAGVVTVFFGLGDEDIAQFADIPSDLRPTSVSLTRNAGGNRTYLFHPRPNRPDQPFDDARTRLASVRGSIAAQYDASNYDEDDGPADWADLVSEALEAPDADWSADQITTLQAVRSWFSEVPEGRKTPRDARLVELLNVVEQWVTTPHPTSAMWDRLSSRLPRFVLFSEEDRELETTYELHPDRREIPPAVASLLRIAGIDPDTLWTHIENADSTKRETLLERGNERLRDLFKQAWNQSGVTVRLNVDGHRLEVLVRELHDGGDVTNISERSDGLKEFVALAAFIAAGDFDVPPILLIDEAETHLHYDAQADLVGVLLKSIDTTQVFYTTHSPGCLPSDLGTGIRVVARDPKHADASVIKNNFWEGEGPGFSPLLFAMGAGAAAFSMCRQAVLAEGASDMVLLPSLIRLATGLPDLDYQVAQGLANAHGSGIRVEEVAAKVVYLVDGDQGGSDHLTQLAKAGVDKSRMFPLPDGHAVEDLIEPADYLTVVNGFLNSIGQGKAFTAADLVEGEPIAKTFTSWARANKAQIPSKVEVAYALLRLKPLRLTSKGKRSLKGLHEKFTNAFEAKPPAE